MILLLVASACTAVPNAAEPGAEGSGASSSEDPLPASLTFALDSDASGQGTVTLADGGTLSVTAADGTTFEIAYTVGLSPGGGVAQTIFDSFSADENAEAASGIGDEAVWYAGGLVVRKGDRLLSLGAPAGPDEASLRTILADLARTAVDRL